MSYCAFTGPPGSFGPIGEPGPECQNPVPGPRGDSGCSGPDGEPGQKLKFRDNKLKEITPYDF